MLLAWNSNHPQPVTVRMYNKYTITKIIEKKIINTKLSHTSINKKLK